MKIAKTKILPPWSVFFHELEAMFAQDDEVVVDYDNEGPTIKLHVDNLKKAEALAELLPSQKHYGSVTLNIIVILPNVNIESKLELFKTAFEGNKAFSRIESVKDAFLSNEIHYILFNKEVVQYPTDDLGDANGIRSTLYQDMADEIFGSHDGIFYCTEIQ